ncbi:bifunctional 2-polyprenyl-6-hydroxyphenol methylase/3-demethylubiquinol 3-O-methyltransferase UbiG [Bacteroides sp. 51]|uniref:class I SAM-dependent methyltransferase n=1 Tax=Bacteroides sp. 51 TaxID=2302938 RepID=UPI0013D6E13D|nr:class I SAM-dependent methyltransferase [Bacteroides sp. 51]NDV80678.1 class I SAM-dependent methyltransferase [Bacteroides sp. 51]
MDKFIVKACPQCSGTHLKHVMTCTDFYASGEQFELHSCEDCQFTFTQGFPTGAAMDRYYESSDYISHSDTKKGMMNSVYHRVRAYMLGRKARLVAKEARRTSGKLLDIGTGTGYFASTMVKKGWEVEAIEKNAQARAFAKERFDLDVRPETDLSTFAPNTFDVITLWHVMEHLENLNETWDRLFELLTDKGILIIAVPNRASYDAEKYGANWAAYDVPRHLWHFTPGTIQQFGSKHGFIMAERYPMPFDAFYVSMLSEKNMKKGFTFLRGMYAGMMAWFSALARKERSSSMIYVFRKKRNEK